MFEIHVFGQTKQRDDETLDQFHTHLRHLAKSCEFSDVDKEVKVQLVEYCKFTGVRRKALQEDVSLDEPLKYGRALETSDRQIAQFENKVIPQRSCFFCGSHFPIEKEAIIVPLQEKRVVAVGKLATSRKFANRHLASHKFLRSLASHEILTDKVRAMMINSSSRSMTSH